MTDIRFLPGVRASSKAFVHKDPDACSSFRIPLVPSIYVQHGGPRLVFWSLRATSRVALGDVCDSPRAFHAE